MEKGLKMGLKTIMMFCCLVSYVGAADPPDLHIAPYLQNVTTTGITIMWETKETTIGKVVYGQKDKLDQSVSETTPVKIHEVHLTGLSENTAYHYQVQYDKEALTPAAFRTAPAPGTKNWRLVVYGDNRSNPDTHARNVQQVMKLNPSIVLNSGDLVARGTEYKQWKEQYFDPLRGLSEYVPIFPCLGNHERNADHYYNYTSVPNENDEVYYSFDYANAHIISLNSNTRDAPFQLGDAQTEWLIKDLKANQDKQWTIVFFHHPLFRCHPTRGITQQRWVWQPIFDEYGVDLVVNGHDHYYQRTYAIGNYTGEARQGVYHLISGGGGAGTYPIVPKIHAAARKEIHHITVMDVQDDRIVGRAIDIDGNTFDAFVYDKQTPNSPEEFMAYEVYTIERDLGTAIRNMPNARLTKQAVQVDQILEVPNPFQVPIRMTFSWQGTNDWQVEPQQKMEMLQPGTPIRLSIKAKGPKDISYPLPVAQLAFSKADGEKAFRNDVVTFYPLKVVPNLSLRINTTRKALTLDGDLSDPGWEKAWTTDDFVDVQGSSRPMRHVKARLIKKDDALYVAAQMEAPDGLTQTGYEGRDNSRAPRNDHFRVHIGVGDQVYTYLVTARGAELDSKGRSTTENLKWNSSFKAVVVATKNGWQAEMVIPMTDILVEGQPLSINLARKDVTANTECEISPTFGPSSLDHRVPMYQGDWERVGGFATLQFK
jgi:hypothetical protein